MRYPCLRSGRRLAWLGWLYVIAAAIACGSVSAEQPDAGRSDGGRDDGGGPTGDFTISATPDTVNVPIAGSRSTTITVSRSGEVGDVMLAPSGLPQGVSVSFALNPLPAGTDTTEATIAIAGGTPPGVHEVTIIGTAGALERSTKLTVTAQTITVAGTVRGGRSGVTVRIVGKAATQSGANGAFTFTDVAPPYDLYTLANGLGPTPTVYYYKGLTRGDPVVDAASSTLTVFPSPRSASVSGAKLGAGNSTSPLVIAWSNTGGKTTKTNDVGGFGLTATWALTQTATGVLHALQWSTGTNGAPTAYLGYGQSPSTVLTSGGTASVNVTLAATSSAGLTGTVSAPMNYPTPKLTLTQQLGNNSHVLWTASTSAVSAAIPVISAGKASLHAISTADSCLTATSPCTTCVGVTSPCSNFVHPALDAATDVSFALPAPAIFVAPIDNATGVNVSTQFQFTAPTGGINTVMWSTSGSTRAAFRLYTTATMVAIPVVPELALPSGQTFTWSVTGFGPVTSIDDAARATPLEGVKVADFSGPKHYQTTSGTRTFTSQ